ncbi:hypothetical protein FRC03_008556 [Tulasnella sp. 419]|nr:hypothetical protein FRC03_008556 [Tulasnella sp. 419]
MDLDPIGNHCSKESCNDLDFLPIACPYCEALYCRHHYSPDAHECSKHSEDGGSINKGKDKVEWIPRAKCAMEGCSKPTLESAAVIGGGSTDESGATISASCPKCSLSFCVRHRHAEAHECKGSVASSSSASTDKNAAARALLAKAFPTQSKKAGTPSTSISVKGATSTQASKLDPVRLAKKKNVELMRMRHRAIPADPRHKSGSVPALEQRRHVSVKTEAKETVFWVLKDVSTGRAIDMLAAQMGVTGLGKPGVIVRLEIDTDDGRMTLRNDQALAEQVSEGEVLYLVKEVH